MNKIDIKVYFNFRSPYCYLASKRMFDVIIAPDIRIIWCPLGGWNGRSSPDRVVYKLPIVRQDVARWCRRLDIPFVPPPMETEPTNAALGSLFAEKVGRSQADGAARCPPGGKEAHRQETDRDQFAAPIRSSATPSYIQMKISPSLVLG